MVCESGGSKSWLAKAAAVEPPDQRRNENLHTVVARNTFSKCQKHDEKWHASWREACFQVNMLKLWGAPANFKKWHGVVARSTFPSQNIKTWDRCRKQTCQKHMSKSKCTKRTTFGRSFVRSCHRWGLKLRETRKRLGTDTKSLHTRRRPSEPRPLSPSLPSCSLFDLFLKQHWYRSVPISRANAWYMEIHESNGSSHFKFCRRGQLGGYFQIDLVHLTISFGLP